MHQAAAESRCSVCYVSYENMHSKTIFQTDSQ